MKNKMKNLSEKMNALIEKMMIPALIITDIIILANIVLISLRLLGGC